MILTLPYSKLISPFYQYAFILTTRGEPDYAVELLKHILWSNAFQDRASQDSIRFAIISACPLLLLSTLGAHRTSACAIHGDRYPIAIEQGRKLINTHQFNNEPFRILLASLGHGMQATDAFLASTLSKHLLRELKTGDTALRNKDGLRWNNVTKRYAPVGSSSKADDDDEEEDGAAGQAETGKDPPHVTRPNLPTKHNPMGVAVYGQICLAAKSYQSALCESLYFGQNLSGADF